MLIIWHWLVSHVKVLKGSGTLGKSAGIKRTERER